MKPLSHYLELAWNWLTILGCIAFCLIPLLVFAYLNARLAIWLTRFVM